MTQYNALLGITGPIKESSKGKNYHKLGLESLQQKRSYTKVPCFSKIWKVQYHKYLFDILHTGMGNY